MEEKTIEEIKTMMIQKRSLKMLFTKAKNNLNVTVTDINEDKQMKIKNAINFLEEKYEETVSFYTQLCEHLKDNDEMNTMNSWMDKIEEEYKLATDNAIECLQQCRVDDSLSEVSSIVEVKRERNRPMSNALGRLPVSGEDQVAGNSVFVDKNKMRLFNDLERLTLKHFSGNNKDNYFEWKSLFSCCVDQQEIPIEAKMLRLKSCLEGDAAELIRGLGNSHNAYNVAIERLEREYGGKKRLLNNTLQAIKSLKIVNASSYREIRTFANKLECTIVNLKDLDQTDELGNGMLLHVAKTRLPESLLIQYERWLRNNNERESVVSLNSFIVEELDVLSCTQEIYNKIPTTTKCNHVSAENNKLPVCLFCNGSHKLFHCEGFKNQNCDIKWNLVKENRLCFKCLGINHNSLKCQFRPFQCIVKGCQQRNHPILHDHNNSRPSNTKFFDKSKTVTDAKFETNCFSHSRPRTNNVALRTVAVELSFGTRKIEVNAILDDCSTASYISESVANELGLERNEVTLNVGTIGGKQTELQTSEVVFNVGKRNVTEHHHMKAYTVKKVTSYSDLMDWKQEKNNYSHLMNLDFTNLAPRRNHIDLLIGMNFPMMHQSIKEVTGNEGEPIARLTPLGWTCVGNINTIASTHITENCHVVIETNELLEIKENLNKLYELDQIKSKNFQFSKEEEKARAMFQETCVLNENRYTVGIPWKNEKVDLYPNYNQVLQKLSRNEHRMAQNSQLSTDYKEIIKRYEENEYIKELKPSEFDINNQYFMPHFPIIKQDKLTTKVRIVFDASLKSRGKSLNDEILPGPKLQQDIVAVLLRFRKYEKTLTCDVKEMYLQIKIDEKAQKFHRFLWRNSKDDVCKVYQFQRLPFGNRAAPFLAQAVLEHHAKLKKDEFPHAYESVTKSTIMDDVIDSRESTSEILKLATELSLFFASAGMSLRKWSSNDCEVFKAIECTENLKCIDDYETLKYSKLLGLNWNKDTDSFSFQLKTIENKLATKRSVLSFVARVYDPLNFIAPLLIKTKILLQKAWLQNLDWDEILPDSLQKEFQAFMRDLQNIQKLEIPRWISFSSKREYAVHMFSDASSEAYCAVAYLRATTEKETTVRFVAAKSRVAPLKAVSIPRLELVAAIQSVRLCNFVCEILNIELSTCTFWVDSTNVLSWIQNESRKFKPFVANRISEIHENTLVTQWRYVPTAQNPADMATRGISLVSLLENDMWFVGPKFLIDCPLKWPQLFVSSSFKLVDKELKKEPCVVLHTIDVDEDRFEFLFRRVSKFSRLVRVVSWMRRFILNVKSLYFKSNEPNFKDNLDITEIEEAEKCIFIIIQEREFKNELVDIKNTGKVSNSSAILSLTPFLAEDGLLRSRGRISRCNYISNDVKYPIILPYKNYVVLLLIMKYHELLEHCGVNHVLAELQQKFWLVKGRRAVYNIVNSCLFCKRRTAKPKIPIMANLPSFRLNSRFLVFDKTGVDFCGPFLTKQGRCRSKLKRYICVFTCLAVRAVHLEVCYSLDTGGFLNAFDRFISRRGVPSEMLSDNGTNFVGAEKELARCFFGDDTTLNDTCCKKGIRWNFNPPYGAHFGGVFESMVKSTKRILYTLFQNGDSTDEELLTITVKIEGILNSRPLTYTSSDPSDELPLTPNNFLFGRCTANCNIPSHSTTLLKRWYYVQEIVDSFWKRWMREYIPMLNKRNKWSRDEPCLAEGDIVLYNDPLTQRGKWPLGRVVKVYPGDDNKVRVVDVLIGGVIYRRPVSRLAILELVSKTFPS